mmetsp:Transcript_16974/g.36952  ORF Transcript_16974/g.36952 Transcript_16974/m.36952 type:complete len:425 (+) Transcript_16974:1-1275(+)
MGSWRVGSWHMGSWCRQIMKAQGTIKGEPEAKRVKCDDAPGAASAEGESEQKKLKIQGMGDPGKDSGKQAQDEESGNSASKALFEMVGDMDKDIKSIVTFVQSEKPQVFYQDEETGESVLMRASANGRMDVVRFLLEKGAPWNALDRKGKCAGEYALDKAHQHIVDLLVDHGVKAEMILGTLETRRIERGPNTASNDDYLKSDVEYTKDEQKLMDPNGDAVMMEWERPLMRLHAQVLCSGGIEKETPSESKTKSTRDILNVGFGMGIIDSYIQEFGAKTHTIIEAHPQVYKRMLEQGWDKKPGVRIVFGRWQDVIDDLGPFDGVFFDTYGEYYSDLKKFQERLPKIMRDGGIYSFFNGLCPRNIFFHGVCCQVVQLELKAMGFSCDFFPCELQTEANSEKTWDGVKRRYWWNDTYYLPVASFTK